MANDSLVQKFWKRKGYYLKLEWIHPFWLRAVVTLVIAAPLFILFVLGTSALVLLVPLIILVKFIGFSWALIVWVVLYGYLSYRFWRWHKHQQKHRPRRPVRR